MTRIRLALVQIDTVVGDLAGNVERISRRLDEIVDCDLALFPEMTVTRWRTWCTSPASWPTVGPLSPRWRR